MLPQIRAPSMRGIQLLPASACPGQPYAMLTIDTCRCPTDRRPFRIVEKRCVCPATYIVSVHACIRTNALCPRCGRLARCNAMCAARFSAALAAVARRRTRSVTRASCGWGGCPQPSLGRRPPARRRCRTAPGRPPHRRRACGSPRPASQSIMFLGSHCFPWVFRCFACEIPATYALTMAWSLVFCK